MSSRVVPIAKKNWRVASSLPKLARVAQREKKFNEFWLQNLLWGYLCNSKLQKTKKLTKPFWRAGGTQAEKSSKFGQNRLCVLAAISKMASLIFLFFAILNHINIPITNFEVRICWTFFSSELPLPTWVVYVYKVWQILKRFAGTFRRAQTLKLGGVSRHVDCCSKMHIKVYFAVK